MSNVWKTIYSKTGKLMYEGFTKNGKPCGAGTSYYGNGNKYQEGVFGIKGLVYGREYYRNGKIRFEGAYKINHGYGPNYPVFGCCYDKEGNNIFEGELKLDISGLGWPKVIEPEGFGHVVLEGKPDLKPLLFGEDEEPVFSFVRPKDLNERKTFIALLDKNGFKCVAYDGRDGTIGSRFPVKVDINSRVYDHIGNVTCAAAAATSKRLCSVEDFIAHLEKLKHFVII